MPEELTNWRSEVGDQNAAALRALYAGGFHAISEVDRIGHLLLYRAGTSDTSNTLEAFVGIALLRRSVTVFNGLRTLFEASSVDPAKALVRALFELALHYRCLAYGSLHPIDLNTPTTSSERTMRARRYLVAAERRALRARAMILAPDSDFPPDTSEGGDRLRAELVGEIARLRDEFPAEWRYFGDVTEASVAKHVGGRDEPPWYAAEFPVANVRSVGRLAAEFGQAWEYEFLYDALSSLVHPRGIRQDITVDESSLTVHHPHDPTWFRWLAWWSLGLQLPLLMTAAKWHAPEMIGQLQTLNTRLAPMMAVLTPTEPPPILR